jgi:hypothetical protein
LLPYVEHRDQLERQAHKVLEALTGQQDLKDLPVLQELQELKGHKAQQEQMGSMDKMAHRLTRHG